MKYPIVNWANYDMYANRRGEFNDAPSLTVPDMSLSLKELLERFVRGENVKTFTPVFTDDEDVPDIERMDEMERLDMARSMKNWVTDGIERIRRGKKIEPTTEPGEGVKPE